MPQGQQDDALPARHLAGEGATRIGASFRVPTFCCTLAIVRSWAEVMASSARANTAARRRFLSDFAISRPDPQAAPSYPELRRLMPRLGQLRADLVHLDARDPYPVPECQA